MLSPALPYRALPHSILRGSALPCTVLSDLENTSQSCKNSRFLPCVQGPLVLFFLPCATLRMSCVVLSHYHSSHQRRKPFPLLFVLATSTKCAIISLATMRLWLVSALLGRTLMVVCFLLGCILVLVGLLLCCILVLGCILVLVCLLLGCILLLGCFLLCCILVLVCFLLGCILVLVCSVAEAMLMLLQRTGTWARTG